MTSPETALLSITILEKNIFSSTFQKLRRSEPVLSHGVLEQNVPNKLSSIIKLWTEGTDARVRLMCET